MTWSPNGPVSDALNSMTVTKYLKTCFCVTQLMAPFSVEDLIEGGNMITLLNIEHLSCLVEGILVDLQSYRNGNLFSSHRKAGPPASLLKGVEKCMVISIRDWKLAE